MATGKVAKELNFPAGLYAKFSYSGTWEAYADISQRIYLEALPKHKLKRAKGRDIEHIFYSGEIHHHETYRFNIDYYVPVAR